MWNCKMQKKKSGELDAEGGEGTLVAMPISMEEVERVLCPWLGSMFLSSNMLMPGIAKKLQEYAPYRQTLESLYVEVEGYILSGISGLTGGDMRVVLDNYQTVRLSLQDVEWMADDVMGLVFEKLTPISMNYKKLTNYSLARASLASLRVLYQKYSVFLSESEYVFLIDMIRQIYPAYRYEAWLGAKEDPANTASLGEDDR